MNERTVEEIVSRFERDGLCNNRDLTLLIASWRERGDAAAAEAMRVKCAAIASEFADQQAGYAIAMRIAALKANP